MSFTDLNLPEFIIRATDKVGYQVPTPIQVASIPVIQKGLDIIAEAQTGTGKTAAFALPIIQRIESDTLKKGLGIVQVLVMTPTRELALQVAESFRVYGQFCDKKLSVTTVIGGASVSDQVDRIDEGTDIVVATPGRLLDLIDNEDLDVDGVTTLVIDEADKLLNLGFAEELDRILEALPEKRQSLLFSATFPEKVTKLTQKVLKDPVRIKFEAEVPTVQSIQQRVIEVNRERRGILLRHLIKTEGWEHVLVFVASKRAAGNLADKLKKNDIKAVAFHGDLGQTERVDTLNRFKKKRVSVLIATDIAARGIDISGLTHVVNFDLPRSPADYIHRIGRTGRAGHEGMAISFIGHEEQAHFKLIEKRAQIKLEREQVEGFELTGEAPKKMKGNAPVKGKRKSKKDKAREAAGE